MFIEEDPTRQESTQTRVSTGSALRHVLVFQLKLAADAFRDFLLSPVSLLAFMIDVLRKPRVENSLYLRLMLIGRKSDRVINLFDDHQDGGEFTIDRAVDELETLLRSGSRARRPEPDDSSPSDSTEVSTEND